VGDDLVVRLRHAPPTQLEELNSASATWSRRADPAGRAYAIERRQGDRVELPRIVFAFAKHGYSDLRAMIDC
jgi:hypothetical protein